MMCDVHVYIYIYRSFGGARNEVVLRQRWMVLMYIVTYLYVHKDKSKYHRVYYRHE